jgi:hypothetical protein
VFTNCASSSSPPATSDRRLPVHAHKARRGMAMGEMAQPQQPRRRFISSISWAMGPRHLTAHSYHQSPRSEFGWAKTAVAGRRQLRAPVTGRTPAARRRRGGWEKTGKIERGRLESPLPVWAMFGSRLNLAHYYSHSIRGHRSRIRDYYSEGGNGLFIQPGPIRKNGGQLPLPPPASPPPQITLTPLTSSPSPARLPSSS